MLPDDQDDGEVENQVIQAANVGNIGVVRDWATRASSREEAQERVSRLFLHTVSSGSPAVQQFLFDSGLVNFNYVDQINERNAMHEAAVDGKAEVLRTALIKGGDVRAPDVYGRLPLHYACMHGQSDMVGELVAAAPDTVDVKDLDNFSPLIHAIVHSQVGCVHTMLQLGAMVNPTGPGDHVPLNLACQYGSEAVIEEMLRYGPNIMPDAEGLYAQHIVARFGGTMRALQMLEVYGVNMDQPDKLYQWTPVFHAANEGKIHCLQQLLDFGVQVSIMDEKGLSAVYYAAWEGHLDCMQLLAQKAVPSEPTVRDHMDMQTAPTPRPPLSGSTKMTAEIELDIIPDLSLPPPIIPLRRYGHNFLDTTKTFILLSFDALGSDAIEFYGDSKYPAARLTISSKSSDLIPRNVPLPVQDDFKNISFQIENVENFSIDFDIFPTFGSKVIARAAASSRVFTSKTSSSGRWHLELFDPRLRAIGRITFRYQVVTPFHGIPLEITHFATYWKATSQDDGDPSNLITGSSLSGDFMRLFVQVTSDGVPVLYNAWALPASRHALISRLTYEEFVSAGLAAGRGPSLLDDMSQTGMDHADLRSAQRRVAQSYASLAEALSTMSSDLHLELHVCYPTRAEEEALNLAPLLNINTVADAILRTVFEHARNLRETKDAELRNFVFSSYNPDICTALNWKQPNCKYNVQLTSSYTADSFKDPVLLCNDLGLQAPPRPHDDIVTSCGRTGMSIKESVRIAQSNNFMGLICSSQLLDLVPALVPSIKEAGLVLISDCTYGSGASAASVQNLPKGVDGLLTGNAVLKFRDLVEQ